MLPDWGAYRAYMRRRRFHPNTVRARMSAAVDWVGFAGPAWESATFDDVEDWMAGRDLSPGSTRNLLVSLRAFYRWTVRTGIVAGDPCQLVESVRLPMRLPRPANDRAIHDLLDTGDVLLSAIVALMAGAGLRCVEVSRLDWCDVDLHAGRVRVVGKGDRERILDVSDAVRLRLAALDHVVGAVFVGPSGDRMSPAAVSIYVNRRARQLALGVTAHQMRHRFATEALRQPGANLLAVRDALGHSSVATTQIYTALLPGLVAEMSRRVTLP